MTEVREQKPNLFRRIYRWILHWADTPYAVSATMIVCFLSPWIAPVPPDILLIPVLLARPDKTIRLGFLAFVLYFLGWLMGYAVGFYGHEIFGGSLLRFFGLEELVYKVQPVYDEYGHWAVLLAAATPVSDKVISIGSGVLHYKFSSFAWFAGFGSLVRIMGPAVLLKFYGARISKFAEKNFEWVAFGCIVLVFGLLFALHKLA